MSDIEARASSLALWGDDLFAWGCREAARSHATVAPTHVYHFAHPQPFRSGQSFREAGDPNGDGLPRWPTYDDAGASILQLDGAPSLVAVPRRDALDFVGVDRANAP